MVHIPSSLRKQDMDDEDMSLSSASTLLLTHIFAPSNVMRIWVSNKIDEDVKKKCGGATSSW